jgi:hypothetical protein
MKDKLERIWQEEVATLSRSYERYYSEFPVIILLWFENDLSSKQL